MGGRLHDGDHGVDPGGGNRPLDHRQGTPDAHRLHEPSRGAHGRLKCKDGYIIIATVGDEHWQRFCRAVNRPDWGADPALQTKAQRWAKKYEIQEMVEKITAQYTIKEVGEMMDKERVANSPILNIQQVVDDPHLKERGYFEELSIR